MMAAESTDEFGRYIPRHWRLRHILVVAIDLVSAAIGAGRLLAVTSGPPGPTSVTRGGGPLPDLSAISGRW